MSEQDLTRCFGDALKILNRASQTRFKMIEKLKKREFKDEIISQTIARLEELKLIDDVKYAHDYVAYRSRSAPIGGRYLQLKLRQRGISKEIAADASKLSAEEEYDLAKKVAEKQLSHYHNLDDQETKQKLARFLQSRGFSSGAVYRIIKGD
ncbi:MAG: regulatory protein RecX [Patescibacteria group bacterium]|jgi:regulatory protein